MWMQIHPDNVTKKNENTVFPDIFKMKEINSAHYNDINSKKVVKPKTDVHHHPATHKPRQLPGRHH
jgi:hypothetical protein